MTTQIDQKAYLQKYLSGPKDKKKKKKRNIKGKGLVIIDDDVDVSKMRPLEIDELDVFGEGEDAPQIAGIIDERPEEIKKLEQFKTSSKWRVINQDDGYNSNLKITEVKKDIKEIEKENEITFGKMYSDSEDEKKNDSDLSPPRKKNDGRKTKDRGSDSDISPPRRKENRVVSKKQENNDSDQSPPRTHNKHKESHRSKKENANDSDMSPPRRKERKTGHRNLNDNDSDLSPPRRSEKKVKERSKARKESRWGYFETEEQYEAKNSKSRENSSPAKKRRDSDQSPPRKRKETLASAAAKRTKSPDSDFSPPRKTRDDRYKNSSKEDSSSRHRYESSSRIPESQRHRRNYAEVEESPPRRKKQNDDEYGDKNRQKHGGTSRRRNESDSDQSPPRKHVRQSPKRAPERYQNDREIHDRRNDSSTSQQPHSRMTKTLEGKMAGLQDARQLRQENDEFRRKEDEAFKRLSDDVSGRNAKAVARRNKRETSEDKEKMRQKAERQQEIDAKYQRWGKGLKQLEDQEARYQDYMHEASKPLARHKGDTDLEDALKQVERAGDPMLKYIREKKRERGEIGPEKPMYKGNFPPNRFNIRPGYRWDGVDRSNGYEKKYFQHQSNRKAQEEEAYKWSTEDL